MPTLTKPQSLPPEQSPLETLDRCSGGNPSNVLGGTLNTPEQSKQVKFRQYIGGQIRNLVGTLIEGKTQAPAIALGKDRTPEIHQISYQAPGTITIAYEWNDRFHVTQMPVDRLVDLHDQLAMLEQERDRLIRAGLAEPGTWIETEQCYKRRWRQAKWRSDKPIFAGKRNPEAKTKSKYIGKEGSPKHQAAIALYKNRQQLNKLTKQIDSIKQKLGDV